ncbi:hypothetical protein CPB84DRAFT_1818132 [Gymnopilus junonius]|uniref:Xylanolytic transcriptional activator regulatory domain-containing protein n=1 Tax=Gymnopilus junonius TaxID=109634 RepID=A0A9P5TEX5_GYMJU|nr:hypothetical protein CPB84DRAFT_1818132 [Gymnopilus junonius]
MHVSTTCLISSGAVSGPGLTPNRALFNTHLAIDYSGPHDLALLFIVLAIGVIVGQEPSNALREHFYQISGATISLKPILEQPSTVTIQALHLTSIYNAMGGNDLKSKTSMEMTWSLVTLVAYLFQTVYCDCACWGLTPKMVQRRCMLFWDLFIMDVWLHSKLTRITHLPSFSLDYIDCSYPMYGANTEPSSSFETWFFWFMAECVAEVAAHTLTTEVPSFATIIELDPKVHDFPLPEGFPTSPEDTVLLYIHCSFFAQAIIKHPINLLKSACALSFLAAY